MAAEATTTTKVSSIEQVGLDFEHQNEKDIYSQLLYAGYHCSRLEEYLSRLSAEGWETAAVAFVRQLLTVDDELRFELAEEVVTYHLVTLASWLVAIDRQHFQELLAWMASADSAAFVTLAESLVRADPGLFVELAAGLARDENSAALAQLAQACDFEGCRQVGFPPAEARNHEEELKKDAQLRDRVFLLAVALGLSDIWVYLCALGLSKEAKVKALITACSLGTPSRAELLMLLYKEADEAALLAIQQGNLAAAVDLYYSVKNKVAFWEATILGHHWQVSRALIAGGLLRLEVFREHVAKILPEAVAEFDAVATPSELDSYPNVTIPVADFLRIQKGAQQRKASLPAPAPPVAKGSFPRGCFVQSVPQRPAGREAVERKLSVQRRPRRSPRNPTVGDYLDPEVVAQMTVVVPARPAVAKKAARARADFPALRPGCDTNAAPSKGVQWPRPKDVSPVKEGSAKPKHR